MAEDGITSQPAAWQTIVGGECEIVKVISQIHNPSVIAVDAELGGRS